jgi:sulfatase maturation enzyme AslB (radical SAM superfamily)
MRIANDGSMTYCRWADKKILQPGGSIQDIRAIEFYQQRMVPVRQALIDGQTPPGCNVCSRTEQHGKISGRQKQLLKTGVRLEHFEKTLVSSPWIDTFTDNKFFQLPQDWQIDLGNYCNSACVFCSPQSSSRLASEWKKIGLIDQLPPDSWTSDPVLVEKFINTLKQSKHIQYLHFIGGETLITPAFEQILKILIEQGINQTATIGFTTNLITWSPEVVELLTQFKGVNLGMSIESFDPVNDYVRWPATGSKVQEILQRWLELANQHNWLVQFRTTPTALSVSGLLSVYEYAWSRNITVESCNFFENPVFMRPSVLPLEYRSNIIFKMKSWIAAHLTTQESIVNIRDPNTAQQQIVQDLQSYVNYLESEPDRSDLLPELIKFLKQLEANRGNSILTYLPEYEQLFRTAGY